MTVDFFLFSVFKISSLVKYCAFLNPLQNDDNTEKKQALY